VDIKSKIIEILSKEHYTFAQLAEYLHMTEDGLSLELGNKTLELRNLEAIAKALRVPLYSFFRPEGVIFDFKQKPFHVNRMWTGDDEQKTIEQLNEEINLLKQIIALKEERLHKLGA
jgi:transcriptional regulator with XRE-family HTH domain